MNQESLQKKIGRVRAPRVQITYDVEIGQATEKRELPLVIGVIGPFGGAQTGVQGASKASNPGLEGNHPDSGFVSVSRAHLDTCISAINPTLSLTVAKKIGRPEENEQLCIDLSFQKLSDFHPDHIITQHPALMRLVETREKLSELRNKLAGNPRLQKAVRLWLLDARKKPIKTSTIFEEQK